jgi:hypothetical protein
MRPVEEFLVTLRTRGAEVVIQGGELVMRPASLVTAEDHAFAAANIEAIVEVLRAPSVKLAAPEEVRIQLDLDNAVLRERAAEAERLERANTPTPTKRYSLYRVGQFGSYVPLHQLTAAQVQRLRTSGHITDEATREWLALQDKTTNRKKAGVL